MLQDEQLEQYGKSVDNCVYFFYNNCVKFVYKRLERRFTSAYRQAEKNFLLLMGHIGALNTHTDGVFNHFLLFIHRGI